MAKPLSKKSVRPHGKPNRGVNRRTSTPASPQDAIQHIADDIESEVLAYIRRSTMQRAINRMDMRQVLGVGGPDLEQFEDLMKEGFSSAIEGDPSAPYGMDRDDRPIIKQVSDEVELKSEFKKEVDSQSQPDSRTKRRRGKK